MANLRDFVNRFVWTLDKEDRGYPLNGSSPGFLSYVLSSLGLNNIATADYYPDLVGNSAMRISTLFTCVLVRGESLSTLPLSVKQVTDNGGSRTATEQPAHRLIHDRPNPFQTASDFWKSVSAHIDLHGNAFAIVTYSGRYQPTRIDLVEDPCSVVIKKSDNGNAFYELGGKIYASYEMLHFKDLSLDGYLGISKVKYNASTVGYAGKLRNYGEKSIGAKPPGYFSTEQGFDAIKKQESALQDGWSGNIAAGKTPLLPFGLKYNNIMISPGDAQYLDAVEATKEDICGMFRVPPTLVQNYQRATFANAEQQDLVFIKYTMLPLITNIEQELNSKLFSEANATSRTPYYVKFNVNAFMRGDFKSRTEGYRSLFNIGAIDGDTIADLEDWNKWEGGNRRFVPMNMIPIDKIDEFLEGLNEPVGSTAGDPGGNPSERSEFKGFLFNGKKREKVNGHAN